LPWSVVRKVKLSFGGIAASAARKSGMIRMVRVLPVDPRVF
jgi:hypothetical protein